MPALTTRVLGSGEKIRVLVVDDSVVIRRLVCHALEQDPKIEVVGVASNGGLALTRIPQLNPDVITLDIEMPEVDGLEFLRRMRPEYPNIRVVMFSTLTERGASATLEALARGADDYVTKASNAGSLDVSLAHLRGELLPKIHQFFAAAPAPAPATPANGSRNGGLNGAAAGRTAQGLSHGLAQGSSKRSAPRPEAVVIGISTGGPAALAELVPMLPGDFPLPILIVQHMPPLFTRLLAERLDSKTKLTVREGASGDRVVPGCVFIAPGDFHMRVKRVGTGIQLVLDQGPPENSCRPAADVLFRSAAELWGGAIVGAVLTGMGQDGLRGCETLKSKGCHLVAQDEASSVVWGMPGAVVHAGLADEVVPLHKVAAALVAQL